MRTVLLSFVLACAGLRGAAAQSFDVASIRPQMAGDTTFFIRLPSNGRFTALGTNAKLLLMLAFDIQETQIAGGPSWLAATKWNIEARMNDGATHSSEETRLMLQRLLADRFHLQAHHEMAQRQVYALVVDKNGARLKASESERTNISVTGKSLAIQHGDMPAVTKFLASALGRPVVDRTGLTGVYDFILQWDDAPIADGGVLGAGVAPAAPSEHGSIFSALQEQLGLRLDSVRAPIDVVVIDRLEPATEN